MRFVVAAGTTETARIEGISAAGADPELMRHTPAADTELLVYGQPVEAPTVPVSPSGCPTPALVTRAVRELLGFDVLVLDAGLAAGTAAPTVEVASRPGGGIRTATPVPEARGIHERAASLGRSLPDDRLVIGESIPGGTTTALGVLTALGEPFGVSSSLPDNPIETKRDVVRQGLSVSNLDTGALSGRPHRAVETMGDPMLAAVSGLAAGAIAGGAEVTLAGGTQMLTVAALLRHAGVESPLTVATTQFLADDGTVDLRAAADAVDVTLRVTDPGFDRADHVAMQRYCAGEGKEGVGMGGALALAEDSGVPTKRVRDRIVERYEAVIGSGA